MRFGVDAQEPPKHAKIGQGRFESHQVSSTCRSEYVSVDITWEVGSEQASDVRCDLDLNRCRIPLYLDGTDFQGLVLERAGVFVVAQILNRAFGLQLGAQVLVCTRISLTHRIQVGLDDASRRGGVDKLVSAERRPKRQCRDRHNDGHAYADHYTFLRSNSRLSTCYQVPQEGSCTADADDSNISESSVARSQALTVWPVDRMTPHTPHADVPI